MLRDTALASRATSDQCYLKLVDRLLYAWITTYRPSYNPIDETHFESLILAYETTASALPAKTREAAATFMTTLGNGYIAQIDARPRLLTGTFRNNWQSHRIIVAMAAFALDDRRMIDAAQRLFVEHVGDNIAPNGSTIDLKERDALHYAA